MSFQIKLDKYEEAYGHFMREIRNAIQETFNQEHDRRGLTQADLASDLDVDPSVISRRLSGSGNVTLRTICDLYTAMGREPLSNFLVRGLWNSHSSRNMTVDVSNNGSQVVIIANAKLGAEKASTGQVPAIWPAEIPISRSEIKSISRSSNFDKMAAFNLGDYNVNSQRIVERSNV